MSNETPMMKQYLRIKEQYRDAVLFFRMGDFYEMFHSDAREVSGLLNLTLTKRNGIPMCGIPYHASQNYIGRLLKCGKKIAICEQTELPGKGQKIAKREVVEVVTPGTVVDDNFLQENSNNYLTSLCRVSGKLSFSYVDLSTGEFITQAFSQQDLERLKRELYRLNSKELIIQESLLEEPSFNFLRNSDAFLNRYPDWFFDQDTAYERLLRQFESASLTGFGFKNSDPEIVSAGAVLFYLDETAHSRSDHIRVLKRKPEEKYVILDEATQKNLELLKNTHDSTIHYTLLEVLDYTGSSSGARKLRSWISQPLQNKDEINQRLEQVSFFYHKQQCLSSLRTMMSSLLDLERLTARTAMDRAHAKDLLSIRNSLETARDIQKLLQSVDYANAKDIQLTLAGLEDTASLLHDAIHEEPSILLTEGRLIKTGFDNEVDRFRSMKENGRQILDDYLEEIKDQTGLQKLRIKYNRIIGYFFEISKNQTKGLPEDFIRRQSLVNTERFTTDRLIQIETELNSSTDKLINREKELFLEIRNSVKREIDKLLYLADKLSELDCYLSLSYCATVNGYSRPELTEDCVLEIKDGRHPVVENSMSDGEYVPNDIVLNTKTNAFLLVTGPNMAGKSTFLRQTALITLMAHIGSYIPASEGLVGIVDRIFCRVGATDNLARGESTFLVEMNETANILHNATEKSLIIMDEVGRGTSSQDGLAIAWSVTEHLLNKIQSRTLFATHYHDLTSLDHPHLENVSLKVLEDGKKIVFLKKIQKGAANSSYGIHVASLAGLPKSVTTRAEEILGLLVQDKFDLPDYRKPDGYDDKLSQMELFDPNAMIVNELASVDPDNMTPIEALLYLREIQKRIK